MLPGKPPAAGFMVRSLKMPSFHSYETARALLRNNCDVHVLGKDAISSKKDCPSKQKPFHIVLVQSDHRCDHHPGIVFASDGGLDDAPVGARDRRVEGQLRSV